MTKEELRAELNDIDSLSHRTLEDVTMGYASDLEDNDDDIMDFADRLLEFVQVHAEDLKLILNGDADKVYEIDYDMALNEVY